MEHPDNTQKEYNYGNKRSSKKEFIAKLRVSGLISSACKESGISRSTYYRWLNTDEKFAQDVNKTMEEAYQDENLKEQLKNIPAQKRSSNLNDYMVAVGDVVDVPKVVRPRPIKNITNMRVISPALVLQGKQVDVLDDSVDVLQKLVSEIKKRKVSELSTKEILSAIPKIVDAINKMQNRQVKTGNLMQININGSVREMEEQMLAMVGHGKEY